MLRNNPMSASISLRLQIARKFPSQSRVERPLHPSYFVFHPSSAPLSPQTPSLPAADPRSDRFRCAGRESKFLADRQRYWMTTGLLEAAFDLHSGAEVDD